MHLNLPAFSRLVLGVTLATLCLYAPSGASAAAGDLTFRSCLSDDFRAGCTPLAGAAEPLGGAQAVTVSPDGNSVYATAFNDIFAMEPAVGMVSHFGRGADGALTFAGCLADDATTGCGDLPGTPLTNPFDVVLRPDGGGVYVSANEPDALLHFFLQPAGQLIYDGCIANNNSDSCTVASGTNTPLDGVTDVAFRPDGKMLYAVSGAANTISRIEVLPGGQLAYRACYTNDATNDCVDLPGSPIRSPQDIAMSPDGNSLYVAASGSDAVSHFTIDANGPLNFMGCISDLPGISGCAVDPPGKPLDEVGSVAVDGGSVFASGSGLAHFFRGTGGAITYDGCIGSAADNCTVGPRGGALVLSSDGASLYAPTGLSGRINQYSRSAQGQLTFQRCYARGGASGSCTDVSNPGLPVGLALSPDDSSVYATDPFFGSLTRFSREPPPEPVVPEPPPEPQPGDPTTLLALDITGKDRQRVDRLKVKASCTLACTVTVQAQGKAGGQPFNSRVATQDIAAGERSVIKPRLKRKVRRQVEGERGRVTLTATAADPSGQSAQDALAAKLKP